MSTPCGRKRCRYAAWFAVLLITEVLIALFVQDAFIRPYGGDILVTILLCCLIRIAFPTGAPRLMPTAVWLFACVVEGLQAINIVSLLRLDHIAFFRVLIGTSFSWIDIVCYAVGCAVFWMAETVLPQIVSSHK